MLILSLSLQPLPAQPCDMDAAPLPAQHAGHGVVVDVAKVDPEPAGCCAAHGVADTPACQLQPDCGHCPAGTPALALTHPEMMAAFSSPAPVAVGDSAPIHRSTQPYRPPIS